ncbi:ArnT family glycosyltransferase [Pseudobacteriovorax antillogorgiicola]|uniref:Dolichyl-phosphate-mannose-protein mannosyltransferase n=1 Tax=Pseudobacteriovorax antillogorgiicola TaxID=1513793 RepID=A0A1Y6CG74_9BACT|nr:glycosyltransferase family 39 protein [Pseudobacteriovorax antillogorgiicola]TCS48982.1 dolichyl-phosphate-mannose-protein mannosyltransferase [Pseudobacteriovorax antillogorgiicola]SMF53495.1 Dolichyl-phosphate-mannose-protein mannosyltransferase [Pseudobacteriovorax antillogorgiicola]
MTSFVSSYRTALKQFFEQSWLGYLFIALYGIRYGMAASIPLGNDEAYYWDWGRALQLSYYDHPPFVAWLSKLGQWVWPFSGYLEGRFWIPIAHLGLSLNLIYIASKLSRNALSVNQKLVFLLATQLAPIINLGGFMLMPDAGLLLWLSAFLALGIYILKEQHGQLSSFQGFLLGLLVGLSFLSKYHGIAIGGAGSLYLFLACKDCRKLSRVSAYLVGFAIAVSPVVFWNIANQFASFRFQLSHGFAEPSFHLDWGLRIITAELLLLTPLVLWGLIKGVRLGIGNQGVQLLCAASLPLLALVIAMSFFKEVLPHWPLPSLWLLSPVIVLGNPSAKSWWFKGNVIYSTALVGILALAVGVPSLRQSLLTSLGGKPQGLGELTLWPYLVEDLKEREAFSPAHFSHLDLPAHCKDQPRIGSFRWFWGAQLSFYMDGQPSIHVFDQNRPSYYDFRDDLSSDVGCPIVFIGDKRHANQPWLSQYIDTIDTEVFLPSMHQDRESIIIWGTIRKPFNRLSQLGKEASKGKS